MADPEAARRLRYYGPNTLPTKKPPTIWAILLHQVLNPLIFILLAAAVASVAIGESTDALFILIVLVLNSGLGTYQEYQAEKSAAGLQRLLKIKARVRRGGKGTDIPAEMVVPGDIVLLESGNKVPADLRLVQANSLAADESFLTGESMASEKTAVSLPEDTGVSDRKNMTFAGSTITSGRGVGIVVGTGTETQVGIIAQTVSESESGKPPLVLRMERFVKHISILVLASSAGLALLLWTQGKDLRAIFFFVVALAVSAIPEGLPVALRRANIGVAMGSETDVAKEVGSMIVTDDNFASIVAGVEEGRFAYDNVRKVIYLLISTGAAEVLMFTAAILTGLPIPLLVVQLLWLNLVTNGIQDVALAFEVGEPGAMKRKPRRPEETIFDSRMISQTLVSGLTIGALAFGFWYWMVSFQAMEEGPARNMVLLLMVLLENVHVFNCRSETESTFRIPLRRNVILIFGVIAAQGIHVMSMYLPFMQTILATGPVSFTQWLTILALALVILVVMEVFKWVKRQSDDAVI